MPACWTLAARTGPLFTGFPWLGLGYSQVAESPLAGYAALLGSYGVTWAAATCAGGLASTIDRVGNFRRALLPVGAIAIVTAVGLILRIVEWTVPIGPTVSVALVQGNVAQERKFSPEVLPAIFTEYRDMVSRTDARLVILPETAFPIFLHQLEPEYLASLADPVAARGDDLGWRITQRRVVLGGRSAMVNGLPSGPITYFTRGRIATVILLTDST